jgi:hypothetical protein
VVRQVVVVLKVQVLRVQVQVQVLRVQVQVQVLLGSSVEARVR